uniref:OTU domain-containing protein n=1 Tax=Mesocestoides corti TaxID=53468 RepID=A0A5K3FZI7_MESCO
MEMEEVLARHRKEKKELQDAALTNNNVGPPKMSKAAKRREKAAAKARCLTAAVEQDIAKHASSATAIEYSKLEAELAKRGLTLYSIPSDGDCLFASIAHQLELRGLDVCLQEACKKLGLPCPTIGDVKSTIRCLRQVASAFIRNHSEDFLPFICLEGPETIELYCKKLETPGTWGGQLEVGT